MKKIITLFYAYLLAVNAFAQLPDVVTNNGYTFVKEWTNDFNAIAPKWYIANWTFEDNLCEFNTKGLTFDEGHLLLTIDKKEAPDLGTYPNKPYWGGEYWMDEYNLYGRYVIKMKPNTPSGVVTSFFLMNIEWNDDYSQALEWSEIDIEFAGTTDAVQFTLHWIDDEGNKHMDANTIPLEIGVTDDFHEWVIEWTPTYISYYLDNQFMFSFTDPELLAEQERPQSIHMNHWVSPHPGWVGVFNEENVPITTTYDQLTYYRLDNITSNKSADASSFSLRYDQQQKQIHVTGDTMYDNYQIVDVNGVLLQKGKLTSDVIQIHRAVTAGLYIVNLQSAQDSISVKLLLK